MQEKRKFISLVVKNAVFYISLILLSSLLIGYFIYRLSYGIVLQSAEMNAIHTLEILELKFKNSIENTKKDVLFIARSPYLKDYILSSKFQTQDLHKKHSLTADYISFLSSRPDYSQIRYIGKKDKGKEILRVDRVNSTINVTNPQELQEKGNTSYFRETIDLNEDSVSFSQIDLNKERGKVSLPKIPTLRASCPVWFNDQSHGIAVINMNLSSLFNELSLTANDEFNIYLTNNKGYALIHPKKDLEFAFEFGDSSSILKLFELNIEKSEMMGKGVYSGNPIFWRKIHYPKQNYELYLLLHTKENKLLASFVNWRWSIIGITLMISAIMTMLALWWLRKQSKDMNSIVQSIENFQIGLETKELPVHRNDEIGIIANTFHEMSDTIKENITKLELAKGNAEAANIQKEEFLQNMSHEIRNPLHAILGMTRMLESNQPKTEQIPLIESLKFSSNILLSLVNDILDFSKLKEGKIKLVNEVANLDYLCKQIVKAYLYESSNKKILLEYNSSLELTNNNYFVDSLRFSQIVSNLLSNAIKFTPPSGKIKIQLETIENLIRFTISDSGPGIPVDKFHDIQKRFQKLERDANKDQYGAGLGLPIVVQLLSLFNSKLELLERKGSGTVFSFLLNLEKSIEVKFKTNIIQTDKLWKNILIIDDDPQIQYWYKHLFDKLGLNVKIIGDLGEIQNLDTSNKYDILITDNLVGEQSVISLLPKVNDCITPHTVKLMLTGNHEIASLQLESNGYFDKILQKPIDENILIESINELWRLRQYNLAEFSIVFEDYDGLKDKIIQSLLILVDEWSKGKISLLEALRSKNNEAKNKIVHRLANSLRRYKLSDLEDYWKSLDCSSIKSDDEQFVKSITTLESSILLAKIHISTLSI